MTTKPYTFSTKAEKAYGLRDSNTVMAVVPGSNRISFSSTQRTTFQNRIFFYSVCRFSIALLERLVKKKLGFLRHCFRFPASFAPGKSRMLRKAGSAPQIACRSKDWFRLVFHT
jgi:hypothetical protein